MKNYIRMFARVALLGLMSFSSMERDLSAQSFDENFMEETKTEIKDRYPDVPSMTVDTLIKRLTENGSLKPLIIDVRDSEEFEVSHLDGAINYPLKQALREKKFDLPHERVLLVYCSVGYRSAEFIRHLQSRGYSNAYNLDGGIFEWKNTGNPVFRDESKVEFVHPYNAKWGRLLDQNGMGKGT